jgi:hypothetical protein
MGGFGVLKPTPHKRFSDGLIYFVSRSSGKVVWSGKVPTTKDV